MVARVGDLARMARVLHGLAPTSAHLFAEALAGAALLGALQKDEGRVNLQLECQGPVRGLLVDADAAGNLRGYVRRPGVDLPGEPAAAALVAIGRGSWLSVLRDTGRGQHYRSAVDLHPGDGLAGGLRRWFAVSDQVETAVDLAVLPVGEERLGDVVGLLVQRLPQGDAAAVRAVRERLARGALARAAARGASPQELLAEVVGQGFDLLADGEVAYRCGCSMARARAAVSALGADGVAEVLAGEGRAVVDCEFCHARYVVDGDALREMERRLREGDGA
jgi:molecular chaperone Hsp33